MPNLPDNSTWNITAYRCTCHRAVWRQLPGRTTWTALLSTAEQHPTVEALAEQHSLHPIEVDNVEALLNCHLATVEAFTDYVEDRQDEADGQEGLFTVEVSTRG